MNTEPPVGDDLQRMLVTMKQNVLERATPRPKRRGRNTGIALGIVGVLLLGAAGGGVALGLIPTSITDQPAPTATSTPEPTQTETPSGAPVTGRPTPTPTPTPAPTSALSPTGYDVADPSTWVISSGGIGPIGFGARVDEVTAPLRDVWTPSDGSYCDALGVVSWFRQGFQTLTVGEDEGTVASITIGGNESPTPPDPQPGPRTAEGVGVGTTYVQLRETYPDLMYDANLGTQDRTGPYAHWSLEQDGRFITFVLGDDGTVQSISVDTTAGEPDPFCA